MPFSISHFPFAKGAIAKSPWFAEPPSYEQNGQQYLFDLYSPFLVLSSRRARRFLAAWFSMKNGKWKMTENVF